VETARRAFLERRANVGRADLVFDSLLDGDPTSDASPRVVMFCGCGIAALLTITRTDQGRDVTGAVFAPGHALALSICRPLGEGAMLPCADDGCLVSTTVAPGTVSLVARSTVDGRAWRCDWIRL